MDIISFSEAATANGRIEKINANPDSSSGIVTVPKVIASTETVTIPAGRVAILPNVTVDGTLNIENGGEVFIPSGATFGDLDAQIALKADTSYVNTQLGLKANTSDLKEIGVGQTWQDVTASRAINTTYTNSTGKPIFVQIYCSMTTASVNWGITIDGTRRSGQRADVWTGNSYNTVQAIIPNGSTYSVGALAGSIILSTWHELR